MLGLPEDFDYAMTAGINELKSTTADRADGPEIASPAEANQASTCEASPGARGWIAPAAMVSGLVLGVLLAASFGIGSDFRAGNGVLLAQGTLAENLASDLSGRGGVGPSFWSKDGSFCRVFSTPPVGATGLSGIACRENGGWRIKIVTARSGSEDLPASVRNMMQNLIVGAPLDAAAEQQLRRQGWRPG